MRKTESMKEEKKVAIRSKPFVLRVLVGLLFPE